MQALLTNIELDIQELKYLMKAFEREPNGTLREVLKRNILQMRDRLDQMLTELDTVQKPVEGENIQPILTETVIEEPVVEDEMEEKEAEDESEDDESLLIEEPKAAVLGESIKMAAGLRHSISLNDSFRFSREIFGGDPELMNRVIEQISVMSSYKTAVAFLASKVSVNEENEAMTDFLELLKKYFNQSA